MVWGCANSDIKGNERLALRRVEVGDIDGNKVIKFDVCHNCAQACCPPKKKIPPKKPTKLGSNEPDCKWWTLWLSAMKLCFLKENQAE